MRVEKRSDGTFHAFNNAGYWIGWARTDAQGELHLQSTSAPLDAEERQAFESQLRATVAS